MCLAGSLVSSPLPSSHLSHHVALFAHVNVAAGLPLDLRGHSLGACHLLPRQRLLVQRCRIEVLIKCALHVEQPVRAGVGSRKGRGVAVSEGGRRGVEERWRGTIADWFELFRLGSYATLRSLLPKKSPAL